MTIAQFPVMTSNETSVMTYVAQIKKYIGDATHSWRQIADIFAAAADEFGFTSDKMKSLMKQTGFSKSKTSKLISISKSKRIRDHYNTFRATEAWMVLYEVKKLTDDEFKKLTGRLDGDEIVTQTHVNSAKTKIVAEVDPYKTVFSVQIDINAIKGGKFCGSEYSELRDLIEEIQNRLNHIRVVESSELDNDAAQFAVELEREFDRVVRNEFSDAKKDYVSRAKDKNRFGLYTKEELNDLMKSKNFEEAFSAIDSDLFDRSRLYDIAQDNVSKKRRDKFVPKMRPHDEFANTAIQVAA
ncbi:MAG: hypothetical protein EBT13_03510 [Rhodobacteraceae bacterium]|nr:hypothetical protein [Paracoccaceae bacterium]